MSGWIKWEKDLETDPRFIRLVRHMRNACVTEALRPETAATLAAGALLRFWSYADTHIRSDDSLDLGLADIDDLVGLPGFAEGLPEDWLVVINDKTVELPNYQQHNGVEARKRALAQKRMQRKRVRDSNDAVTHNRNTSVTGASPDQDQDQTKKNTSGKPDNGHDRNRKKNGSEHRHQAVEILDHLNETAGRNFQHTDTNLGFIIARLKAGATPDQCRAVIDQQVEAWSSDPKMAPYLRPQTLFNREKFDAYAGLIGATLPADKHTEAPNYFE